MTRELPRLSEAELERYGRQIDIPGWGRDGQRRLKAACVGVAGAGGLGSAALLYLAAAGFGRIVVVDHDEVSLNNLNRQVLHWERDIGAPKVESASAKLAGLNPAVDLVSKRGMITEANAGDLLGDVDAVIDCLDNFPARFAINDFCVRRRVPLFHGAVWGMEGRVTTVIPGKTPCLTCLYPEMPAPEKPPVCGTTPALVATLQVTEAIKYFTEIGVLLQNEVLLYDGTTAEFTRLTTERDPQCRVCSGLSDPGAD